MRKILLIILALSLALVPMAFAQDTSEQGLLEIAAANPDLSTLAELVTQTGLVEILSGEGPFTVFAPTNDAFAALDADALADPDFLEAVLRYHVIDGQLDSFFRIPGNPTLQSGTIQAAIGAGGVVTLNDSATILASIDASNGIIHVIDAVLIPEIDEAVAEEEATEEVAAEAAPAEAELPPLTAIALGNPDLSTLVDFVVQAGLVESLSGGPFTVFAPTNDAFAALDADTLAALESDTELLTAVLTYHVIPGVFTSDRIGLVPGNLTLQGGQILPTIRVGGRIILNGVAEVTTADVLASNGVVHLIDTVLIPEIEEAAAEEAAAEEAAAEEAAAEEAAAEEAAAEEAAAEEASPETAALPIAESDAEQSIVEIALGNPEFSTLVSLVLQAGLADTLSGEGPYTVFAPTNAAFAALDADTLAEVQSDPARLEALLLYHVIDGDLASFFRIPGNPTLQGGTIQAAIGAGGVVTLNDSATILQSVDATNGTVHAIDAVLIPDFSLAPPTSEETTGEAPAPATGRTLIDVFVENPDYETLVDVLGQANLTDMLSSETPYTVFAPTDSAFTATGGLSDNLDRVLLYHIIPGSLNSQRLIADANANGGQLNLQTALAGTFVTIRVSGNNITVNGVPVVAVDRGASNGVYHVLSGVLQPPPAR